MVHINSPESYGHMTYNKDDNKKVKIYKFAQNRFAGLPVEPVGSVKKESFRISEFNWPAGQRANGLNLNFPGFSFDPFFLF